MMGHLSKSFLTVEFIIIVIASYCSRKSAASASAHQPYAAFPFALPAETTYLPVAGAEALS
jgi:hypothetical protein